MRSIAVSAAVCLMSAVSAFAGGWEDEVFVLSNANLRVAISLDGAEMTRCEYKGVTLSVAGQTSFADRLVRSTGEATEDMEVISGTTFGLDRNTTDKRHVGYVFSAIPRGFSSFRLTKTYFLGTDEEGTDEVFVFYQLKNLSDAPQEISYATGMKLLPGLKTATLLMPTKDGVDRIVYPGSSAAEDHALNPASRVYGVHDPDGFGFAFVAPQHRTGCFYTWKNLTGQRLATQEFWGIDETVPAGGEIHFIVAVKFSSDIPALLARTKLPVGKLLGKLSSHLRRWPELGGKLKVNRISGSPERFRRTYELDLRRQLVDTVYSLDLEDADPAGIAVYPLSNGQAEYDRPYEVEATKRTDGKVRLLLKMPGFCPGRNIRGGIRWKGDWFIHNGRINRGRATCPGVIVWDDPSAKLLPSGTLKPSDLLVFHEDPYAIVPRPAVERYADKLVKDFKIPLDFISRIKPGFTCWHKEWFKPAPPIDVLYLNDPTYWLLRNEKRLVLELQQLRDIRYTPIPLLADIFGIEGRKPFNSTYRVSFGEKVGDWSMEQVRAVATPPKAVMIHNFDFVRAQPELLEIFARWRASGSGFLLVDCENVPKDFFGEKCRVPGLDAVPHLDGNRRFFIETLKDKATGVLTFVAGTRRVQNNPSCPKEFATDRYPVVYSREFPYYDYATLALVKALGRLADGEGAVTIEKADEKALRLAVRTAGTYRLETTFMDYWRTADATTVRELRLKPGTNVFKYEIPSDLPGGFHAADVRLLDADGRVVDAAGFAFTTPETVPLAVTFAQTNRIFNVGERIAGTVAAEGADVEVELEDADFRVVARSRGTSFAFALPAHPAQIYHVWVRAKRDGKVVARTCVEVSVRHPPWDVEDVHAHVTTSPSPPYIMPLLRDFGFDLNISGFENNTASSIRQCANLGLMSVPRNCANKREWAWPYRGDNPTAPAVRTPCYSSPEWKEELRSRIREVGAKNRYDFYNVRVHWLGDEVFLGSNVCYSPSCLKEFREALAAAYGTVAALNAEWGTSFASFDEVLPCQLKELPSRDNLSRWLDHKMFMASQFARHWVGGATEALNEVSPGSLAGPTGTPVPGYGHDWSQLLKYLDAIGYYGGAQRKLVHDFAELYGRNVFGGQCGGGYTHTQFDYEPYEYDIAWRGLLSGANIAYFFFGTAFDGDFGYTPNLEYFTKSLRELKSGVGKLFLSARGRPEIAVLYSHASLFTAMATCGGSIWQNAQTSWWMLLSDLKYDFRFVPYEHLAEKGLDGRYKVLVLPCSLALSDAERKQIAAFVARGGTVLADVEPGVRDGHGKLVSDRIEGVRALGEDLATYNAVDLGGAAGESASTTSAGGSLGESMRTRVARELVAAGVKPMLTAVDRRTGGTYPCGAAFRFDGENAVAALHLETHGDPNGFDAKSWGTCAGRIEPAKGDPVRMTLPFKGHVYDIREGKYLGCTDAVETTMVPGWTRIYSILKEKPGTVTVEGPKTVKPGERAVFRFATANAKGPQVFHVELADPKGKAPWRFRENVRTTTGGGTYVFDSAFNDTPGTWTLTVRHVNTGETATSTFTVPEG